MDEKGKYGKWNLSPMREAGTLLGVLRQEGLAGKGLVAAFERWSPRLLGYSRTDFADLYRNQTGKELTDIILIQKADKMVRNRSLGPDAVVIRQQLQKARA